MKKRIGISFTETQFQNYLNWFIAEDLQDDIEFLVLSFEENNTEDISACNGFILTGGVDVDASLYDGSVFYENKPASFNTQRDAFEEKIYRCSQSQHLPLLGICRGLQLVNVLQGGKLIQDLGIANENHRASEKKDKQHEVHIENGSLLNEITGLQAGKVNSSHHQAIDPSALGENLQVNAWADNSIAEGIEFKDKTGKAFMLCVQWHPERMHSKEENPLSKKIKESFLQAIRNE
jgi:putative glutamine amidotransferase